MTNPINFKKPISLISENISPKLNASPNESYLANLHCAIIMKRPNMMNNMTAIIAVIIIPVANPDHAPVGINLKITLGSVELVATYATFA